MQTMTRYMKLFGIFITITLFSNYLYGTNIRLDGNIQKINGDRNLATCAQGDIYRLSNTTTYGGQPFDLLLSIVNKRNDYNATNVHCIRLDKQTTNRGIEIYVIETYLKHHSRGPNEPEDNLTASMELEFIAIDKTKSDSEIINSDIHADGFGLDLGVLNLAVFDLDGTHGFDGGDAPTLTDDLYVRIPSTVEVGESNLTFQDLGLYQKLQGLSGYDCQDTMANPDSSCRGYAKLMLNALSNSFKFRIQNDNAYGHDTSRFTKRKFSFTLEIPVEITTLDYADGFEGEYLDHKVILSAPSVSEERYTFSIENNTTADNDYEHVPTFSTLDGNDVNVSYDSINNEVVVGAGVTEFYIKIYANYDEERAEPAENYVITLDELSAPGFIYSDPS